MWACAVAAVVGCRLPLAVGVVEHYGVVEILRDIDVGLILHLVAQLDGHHAGRRVDAVGHVKLQLATRDDAIDILTQVGLGDGHGSATIVVGRNDELDPVTLVVFLALVHDLGRSGFVSAPGATDVIDVVGELFALGHDRLLAIVIEVLGIQGTLDLLGYRSAVAGFIGDLGLSIAIVVNTQQVVADGVTDVLPGRADEAVERVGVIKQAQVVIHTAVDKVKVAGLLLGVGRGDGGAVVEEQVLGSLAVVDGAEVIFPNLVTGHRVNTDAGHRLSRPGLYVQAVAVDVRIGLAAPCHTADGLPADGVDEIDVVVAFLDLHVARQGLGRRSEVLTAVGGHGVVLLPGVPQHTSLAGDGFALVGGLVGTGEDYLGNRGAHFPVPPLLAIAGRGVALEGDSIVVGVGAGIPVTLKPVPCNQGPGIGAVIIGAVSVSYGSDVADLDVVGLLQIDVHGEERELVGPDELHPAVLDVNDHVVDASGVHVPLALVLVPHAQGHVDVDLVTGDTDVGGGVTLLGDKVVLIGVGIAIAGAHAGPVVAIAAQRLGEAEGGVGVERDVVQVVQLLGVVILHEHAVVGGIVVDGIVECQAAHHVEVLAQLAVTLDLELHLGLVKVDGDVAGCKPYRVGAMVTFCHLG